MKIVFTGACESFTRKELEKILNEAGITMQKQIAKSTDFLVLANKNTRTNKAIKAKEWKIPIMIYDDFFLEYIPEYFI